MLDKMRWPSESGATCITSRGNVKLVRGDMKSCQVAQVANRMHEGTPISLEHDVRNFTKEPTCSRATRAAVWWASRLFRASPSPTTTPSMWTTARQPYSGMFKRIACISKALLLDDTCPRPCRLVTLYRCIARSNVKDVDASSIKCANDFQGNGGQGAGACSCPTSLERLDTKRGRASACCFACSKSCPLKLLLYVAGAKPSSAWTWQLALRARNFDGSCTSDADPLTTAKCCFGLLVIAHLFNQAKCEF